MGFVSIQSHLPVPQPDDRRRFFFFTAIHTKHSQHQHHPDSVNKFVGERLDLDSRHQLICGPKPAHQLNCTIYILYVCTWFMLIPWFPECWLICTWRVNYIFTKLHAKKIWFLGGMDSLSYSLPNPGLGSQLLGRVILNFIYLCSKKCVKNWANLCLQLKFYACDFDIKMESIYVSSYPLPKTQSWKPKNEIRAKVRFQGYLQNISCVFLQWYVIMVFWGIYRSPFPRCFLFFLKKMVAFSDFDV